MVIINQIWKNHHCFEELHPHRPSPDLTGCNPTSPALTGTHRPSPGLTVPYWTFLDLIRHHQRRYYGLKCAEELMFMTMDPTDSIGHFLANPNEKPHIFAEIVNMSGDVMQLLYNIYVTEGIIL